MSKQAQLVARVIAAQALLQRSIGTSAEHAARAALTRARDALAAFERNTCQPQGGKRLPKWRYGDVYLHRGVLVCVIGRWDHTEMGGRSGWTVQRVDTLCPADGGCPITGMMMRWGYPVQVAELEAE